MLLNMYERRKIQIERKEDIIKARRQKIRKI